MWQKYIIIDIQMIHGAHLIYIAATNHLNFVVNHWPLEASQGLTSEPEGRFFFFMKALDFGILFTKIGYAMVHIN